MAFTTVPTPLWSLYAQRDRFSSFTVTIVFAAYALAVALSLFLAGHLSDWYGRRRVLMPALALEILASVVFLVWPALPGLLLARVLSGLGIGAVTATATAWLSELVTARRQPARADRRDIRQPRRPGPRGADLRRTGPMGRRRAARAVRVFLAALSVAWVALLAAPETRARRSPRPRYRPQRVSVPPQARGRFFAAALGARSRSRCSAC